MLEDGTYDVFVVDATATGDGGLRLDVTVLDGPHKSEVVPVQASGLTITEIEAIGMPGTLTVRDGRPALRIEGC